MLLCATAVGGEGPARGVGGKPQQADDIVGPGQLAVAACPRCGPPT